MINKTHGIVEELKNRLIQQAIEPLKVFQYGSSVYNEDSFNSNLSDIDVLIIVNSINVEVRKQISNIAWEVGFEHDVFIHTVAMSEYEAFESPAKSSMFLQNIYNEGLLV